jgi:hypothetical protein
MIVMVADADAQRTVEALLSRPESLRIRPVDCQIERYPGRDSGCFRDAPEYLRSAIPLFDRALVVFDRHGCGRDDLPRELIELDLEERLARNGWRDRAAAVVLDPELEAWVWSTSPHVAEILGWAEPSGALREWLEASELLRPGEAKPDDPKEAMKRVLRAADKKPSPALFGQLAERVGLGRCVDPAFGKFQETLQRWFPPS